VLEENKKPIGQVHTPDGMMDVLSMFRTVRDDREVTMVRMADGSIGLVTESWLRKNNREKITTTHRYTEGTLAMMLQTIMLGASYIGLDLNKMVTDMAVSGNIEFECAGDDDFEFKNPFEEETSGTENV
jgi:hypothetical protein